MCGMQENEFLRGFERRVLKSKEDVKSYLSAIPDLPVPAALDKPIDPDPENQHEFLRHLLSSYSVNLTKNTSLNELFVCWLLPTQKEDEIARLQEMEDQVKKLKAELLQNKAHPAVFLVDAQQQHNNVVKELLEINDSRMAAREKEIDELKGRLSTVQTVCSAIQQYIPPWWLMSG